MRNLSLASFALLFAAGCGGADTNDDFSDLSTLDTKSDAFSAKMKIVGAIKDDTNVDVTYTTKPKYRALTFQGTTGDAIEVNVSSDDGDPTAWILDAGFKIVKHENAAPSGNSMVAKLATKLASGGEFYIVVRDREGASNVTFSVYLHGATVGDFYSCKSDKDCVATPRNECCGTGWMAAVNKNEVDAYHASFTCPQAHPICPLYLILDTDQPECNIGTHKCEMVKIADIKCGGLVVNPHACPANYDCSYNNVPDVPGSCKQQCVDNVLCIQGTHWDSNACKCVADPKDNCGGCKAGDYCSLCWGKYACIPNGALC